MGAEIDGPFPSISEAGLKPSSAVLPGALQVTPQGRGYLLLPDGQTTGGYPHLLQVIRADRHLLGQLRPGDSLRFLLRLQAEAEAALAAKQALIAAWVPDLRL
jgi:allophanate hydrolase subunit 2